MHQALSIHEVVLQIASELHSLNPTQLPSLALTCKAFLDPTSDILWANLPSFIPLLRLMPDNLIRGNGIDSSLDILRRVTLQDLSRFLAFSSRVRTIQWLEPPKWVNLNQPSVQSVDLVILTQVAKGAPSSPILPGLKKIKWAAHSIEGLTTITRYMSPSLTSVEMSPTEGVQAILHSKIVGCLASLPRLRQLHLAGTFAPHDLQSVIQDEFAKLFCQESFIEQLVLDVQPPPPQLLDSIYRLPRLKSLVLNLGSWAPENVDSNEFTPGFRHLEKLAICSTMPAATTVLSHVVSPYLHNINISLTGTPSYVIEFALPSHIVWDNLSSLTISGGTTLRRDLTCRMSDLQPVIASCSKLTIFDICFYIPDLDDAALTTMATAWPKIAVLHLESAPENLPLATHRPRVTLAGLQRLVAYCPELRTLSLCIDATKAPRPLLAGTPITEENETLITSGSDFGTLLDENPYLDESSSAIQRWCRLRLGTSLISQPRMVERSLIKLGIECEVGFWFIKEAWSNAGWIDEPEEDRNRRDTLWREVHTILIKDNLPF